MHPFENLGLALRWLRRRCNRTQLEVARAAKITKAMVSAYENERSVPTLETLGNVLRALDADLRDLQDALELQGARRSSEAADAIAARSRGARPS